MADDYNIDQLSEEDKALLIKEYGEEIALRLMANTVDEKDKEEFTALERQTKENAVFDLDAALDSYDPTFPRYTPSEDAFEFFTLMRMVEG